MMEYVDTDDQDGRNPSQDSALDETEMEEMEKSSKPVATIKIQVTKHGYHTQNLSCGQVKKILSRRSPWGLGATHKGLPSLYLIDIPGFRNQSTDSSTVVPPTGTEVPNLPDGYIPEPPPIPTGSPLEDILPQLNALGEPTLQSLGLGGWWPSGMIQTALETLHVTCDLPWFGAIIATTVVLRTLMFPLVVMSQKNAANMNNHMPTVQRLQEKFTKARNSGNPLEAARASHELFDYMKRNKVNPLKNMIVPLTQLPVFLSVFVGIRQMANLPLESMMTGGLLWFTDLTATDPFYALPIMTSATFLLTIELGVDGVKAGTMSPVMRNVIRVMPLIMLPFIMNFPSAMLVYWFTSNVFSLGQVLTLKIPRVRKFFQIPESVKHEESTVAKKKSFREGFKESMSNAKMANQVYERERMDAVRFKEAATGPLQKTYSHDPTKSRPKEKKS